jgi:hypothetical protein
VLEVFVGDRVLVELGMLVVRGALVDVGMPPAPALLDVLTVLAVAGVLDAEDAAEEVVDCLEPPHAARNTAAATAPRICVKCLTFSAYGAVSYEEDGVERMRLGGTRAHDRLVEYDAIRHRLWILGQRCHHGATGSVVAATACVGLIAGAIPPATVAVPRSTLAVSLAAGGALMVHDWKDRSLWFERGRGSQS